MVLISAAAQKPILKMYTSGKDVHQFSSVALMLIHTGMRRTIMVCQHAATIMERLRGYQQPMEHHAQRRIVVLVPQAYILVPVVKGH